MSNAQTCEFIPGGDSNVFIREMYFEKAGDQIVTHQHNFDHVTYVPQGALRIEKTDGINGPVIKSVEVRAGRRNWILIRAGVCHRVTALEDDSVGHCTFAHRTPQGEVTQTYDGWEAAHV